MLSTIFEKKLVFDTHLRGFVLDIRRFGGKKGPFLVNHTWASVIGTGE
jgi:hypothetical protein